MAKQRQQNPMIERITVLIGQIPTMDIAAIVAACSEVGIQYQLNSFKTDEEAREAATTELRQQLQELQAEDEEEAEEDGRSFKEWLKDTFFNWSPLIATVEAVLLLGAVGTLLWVNHQANVWKANYENEAAAYQELATQFKQLTQVPEGIVPQVAIEETSEPPESETPAPAEQPAPAPAPAAYEEVQTVPAPVAPQTTQPAQGQTLSDIIE